MRKTEVSPPTQDSTGEHKPIKGELIPARKDKRQGGWFNFWG